jgi:hypothetical protein
MKTRTSWVLLTTVILGSLSTTITPGFAQGTAFTYQGRLMTGTNVTNGPYDLTFALFNASSGPSQVGSTITDTGTGVTNGLFTVVPDYGAVFNGTAYWLEITARTNGVGGYATLSPRQQLTPTPYAIYSEGSGIATTANNVVPSAVSARQLHPCFRRDSRQSHGPA